MISKQFDYIQLSRTTKDGVRWYHCPDGTIVPSVTTILSKTSPESKKQVLANWSKRLGAEKAQEVKEIAASRGARMHSFLEHYIMNDKLPNPGSHPLSRQGVLMAKAIVDRGFRNIVDFYGSEVSLYYPELYAGTTDAIGVHEDGSLVIIDFKQTNKPKRKEWIDDYFLQLAFYGTAHNRLYNTNIKKGIIMMSVAPQLDYRFQIITGPVYQEFILEPSQWGKYESMMWDRVEQFFNVGDRNA